MATQIWTLQICIVLFRLKINLKFGVKFINVMDDDLMIND